MIRALFIATRAIVLSVFIASVLIIVAILAALVVVSVGCKMALWPSRRGISNILFERIIGRQ